MLFSLLLPVYFILPSVYYLTALSSISNYHYPLPFAPEQKILPQAAYSTGFQESSVRNCVKFSQLFPLKRPDSGRKLSYRRETLTLNGPELTDKKNGSL